MNFTRQQLIFLGVVAVIVVGFLALVFVGGRDKVERVDLTIWGVDDEQVWDYAIYQFQKTHPGVRLKYTEFNPDTYEKELINALAANRGPDIFMLNNRWVVKHSDKIVPMPREKISLAAFSSLFPQVVEQDFTIKGEKTGEEQISGLPLSLDTLALLYNRDIFDRKGAPLPPKTWEEFLVVIPKLRSLDKAGNITLAAAAIGGSRVNIPNAPDILQLLLLQTGAISSDEYPSETVRSREGENTLTFYIQFIRTTSTAYTWNDTLPEAFDAFAEERTAMLFAYANDIPEVEARNPFLNFGVEPAPQADLTETVSLANYWALAASSKTKNLDVAWDFIIFAATDKNVASRYLTSTGRPPALRSLIDEHLNDIALGVFARQALTARSFYEGDDEAFGAALDKAIRRVITGNSVYQALQELEIEIRKTERLE